MFSRFIGKVSVPKTRISRRILRETIKMGQTLERFIASKDEVVVYTYDLGTLPASKLLTRERVMGAFLSKDIQPSMKRLILGAGVMALMVVGCGGGGSDSVAGGGGGGGTVTRVYPEFSRLTSNAAVNTVFLTGIPSAPAPRAVGSRTAVLSQLRFGNFPSNTEFVPESGVGGLQNIQLDSADIPVSIPFSVFMSPGQRARAFTDYRLQIDRIEETQLDGTQSTIISNPFLSQRIDVDLKVFPGRVSTITFRLNDSTLNIDGAAGTVSLTDDFFTANYDETRGAVVSSLSDYMAFDLSGVNAGLRPVLNGGGVADRVFFSGDGYGISQGIGPSSEFELLSPVSVQNGTITDSILIGPPGDQRPSEPLILLEEVLLGDTRRTSVVSTWKKFDREVTPPDSGVVAIAFPNSRENNTDDVLGGNQQQFVIYTASGSSVTNLWYGTVFYSTINPGIGTFRAFPVATVTEAQPANPVTGTVSGISRTNINSPVMRGNWTLDTAAPSGWTFGSSGTFGVYRK
jgi:hypothetical protein